MNEQQGSQQQHAGQCVCGEVIGHIQGLLGVSPSVREHLTNSRIEFLKAIRTVIDERIERLSTKGPKGAKIAVE